MTQIGPVEAGVPIKNLRGSVRLSIEEMKKGESRTFAGMRRNCLYMAASRSGIVVTVKPEGKGFRVWRRT